MVKVKTPPSIIEERVNEIYKMLLNGANHRQIHATIRKQDRETPDKAWNVSSKTVTRYIERASKYLEAESQTLRQVELGRAIARQNDIYAKSMQVRDYRAAQSAAREINLILGLYAPEPTKTINLMGLEVRTLEIITARLKERGENPTALFDAIFRILENDSTNPALPDGDGHTSQ